MSSEKKRFPKPFDHSQIGPLLATKARLVRLHIAVGVLEDEAPPWETRLLAEQLENAVDNMLRIAISGTLREGMEEAFEQRCNEMALQLDTAMTEICSGLRPAAGEAVRLATDSGDALPLQRLVREVAGMLSSEGVSLEVVGDEIEVSGE